jgi:hypothetical protein
MRPQFMVLAIVVAAGLTAQTPATGPVLSLAAITDNVSGARDSIRIDVLRWSNDAERDRLLAAWNQAVAPPKAAAPETGKAGKAAGKAAPAPASRATPESALTAALDKAPSVGHLWSSEIAGYSLRYAVRLAEQDGGERIVLITERRLGAWNDLWKPAGAGAATNYEFSVVELHLNAKGEGEGKVSLTGKVAVDGAAKTIGLENYSALPVVLKNVRRRT